MPRHPDDVVCVPHHLLKRFNESSGLGYTSSVWPCAGCAQSLYFYNTEIWLTSGWCALQGCPAPGLPPTWGEGTERLVEDIGEALLRASGLMQEMKKAGVVATDGFFRGPPQINQLGVEAPRGTPR